MTTALTLLTRRDDLAELAWLDALPGGGGVPTAGDLPAGSVLLQVEAVALTANTLTYGLLGERLHYWDAFPVTRLGWGCLPAWGTAVVAASTLAELPVGERIAGLLPVATHCLLQPVRVTASSLRDGATHRRPLAAAYQHYERLPTRRPAGARSPAEELGALLRPLFFLAFLLADDLRDADAQTVVVTSASSRTSKALAQQLSGSGIRVLGLTAPARVAAASTSGSYDAVLGYPDVAALPAAVAGDVVVVDVAGDASLCLEVREALAGRVVRTVLVGATHRPRDGALVADAADEVVFSAADRLRQRATEWGQERLRVRQEAAWASYVEATRGSVEVLTAHGRSEVAAAYREVLDGRCPPSHGHLLSPAGDG